MLNENELGRVCVVLVRARNPANIGAAARAMHDFGFSRLRVVNDFPLPFLAARSAVDAADLLAAAVSYDSVSEAVGDCTLVVGTSAVGERDVQYELLTLAEAGPRIRAELSRNPMVNDKAVETFDKLRGTPALSEDAPRIALLFGSEKTGLSNEELSHCNWLLTIPMYEHAGLRHPSMNLGQAVAVCLYELVRAATSTPNNVGPRPTTAANLERVTELLTEVMQRTEYTRRHPHNCDPAHVRRLVRRIGMDAVDAPVWLGILKQILWKLGGGREH